MKNLIITIILITLSGLAYYFLYNPFSGHSMSQFRFEKNENFSEDAQKKFFEAYTERLQGYIYINNRVDIHPRDAIKAKWYFESFASTAYAEEAWNNAKEIFRYSLDKEYFKMLCYEVGFEKGCDSLILKRISKSFELPETYYELLEVEEFRKEGFSSVYTDDMFVRAIQSILYSASDYSTRLECLNEFGHLVYSEKELKDEISWTRKAASEE